MKTKSNRPVAVLTDFGAEDGFAGVMKGVMAAIYPDIHLIDITHAIRPQDIGQAAFVLLTVFSYFPKGTVFCVVVDPGVGSDRKGICIRTRNYFFVGPDNGVLWTAAEKDGIQEIFNLSNTAYFLPVISSTFHGRDIFAPVSAHVSKGLRDLTLLGEKLHDCNKFKFPAIKKDGNKVGLTVLHTDHFGNIVLNIRLDEFDHLVGNHSFELLINRHVISKVFKTYARADEGELFLIASSNNFMEVSLKNGNAADMIHPGRLSPADLKIF